jgi:hypothetical protein
MKFLGRAQHLIDRLYSMIVPAGHQAGGAAGAIFASILLRLDDMVAAETCASDKWRE